MVTDRKRRLLSDIFRFERFENFGCGDLATGGIGDLLNYAAEFDLHFARQLDAVVALQEKRDSTFAGLTVDANDGLIAAAEILGIDREVRDGPKSVGLFLSGLMRGEAFLDGVLVRA